MPPPVPPVPGGAAPRPPSACSGAGADRTDPRDDRLDTLVAATLLLMTPYVRDGGSPRLAAVVGRHLEALADHADTPGVLGATCEQAADHWSTLAGPAPAAGPVRSPRSPTGAAARRRPWLRLVPGRSRARGMVRAPTV